MDGKSCILCPFVPLHWWVQRCLLRVDSGDMVSCNCRCVAKEGQPANSKDDYSKWCSSFFSRSSQRFAISLHPSLSVPETVSLSGMCHSKTTMPHSETFGVQLNCVFSFAPNLPYGDCWVQLVYVKCLLKVKLGAWVGSKRINTMSMQLLFTIKDGKKSSASWLSSTLRCFPHKVLPWHFARIYKQSR